MDPVHSSERSGSLPDAAAVAPRALHTPQFRIVNSDTGRRLMDYASRAHTDAWLRANPGYRVYSQHTDSTAFDLHAIYVEAQAMHASSMEGGS